MKDTLVQGAIVGAVGFLPPVAIGLVAGGTLVVLLLSWRRAHNIRVMMEEIAWLERLHTEGTEEDWRKLAEE
jgi:Flp pilus assembly protein protease CpaA